MGKILNYIIQMSRKCMCSCTLAADFNSIGAAIFRSSYPSGVVVGGYKNGDGEVKLK